MSWHTTEKDDLSTPGDTLGPQEIERAKGLEAEVHVRSAVFTEVLTKVLPMYRLPFRAEIPFTLRVFFLLLPCNLFGGGHPSGAFSSWFSLV